MCKWRRGVEQNWSHIQRWKLQSYAPSLPLWVLLALFLGIRAFLSFHRTMTAVHPLVSTDQPSAAAIASSSQSSPGVEVNFLSAVCTASIQRSSLDFIDKHWLDKAINHWSASIFWLIFGKALMKIGSPWGTDCNVTMSGFVRFDKDVRNVLFLHNRGKTP